MAWLYGPETKKNPHTHTHTPTQHALNSVFSLHTSSITSLKKAEAEYSDALLLPFCRDANGSFIPTDRSYNPGVHGRQAPLGKGLVPRAGLRAVFEDGKAPQVGQLEISVEEGMIQKLSRRVVADASVGGCKLLDATLTEDVATGLLVKQTYALIAAQCILLSAQAAVQTIRRNVQRNTRFHL